MACINCGHSSENHFEKCYKVAAGAICPCIKFVENKNKDAIVRISGTDEHTIINNDFINYDFPPQYDPICPICLRIHRHHHDHTWLRDDRLEGWTAYQYDHSWFTEPLS